MKTIAEEVGDLGRMTTPKLLKRYRELWGTEPKIRARGWLEKRIVWKLQADRAAGETTAGTERPGTVPVQTRGKHRKLPGAPKRPRKPGEPAVGNTLIRRWHEKDLHIRVVDGGFEYEGVVHRSLSAAATAITGAHWNGRLFFQLTGRAKK